MSGGASPSGDRAGRPSDGAGSRLHDTATIPSAFTPGPWKTGDCDSFIIWASGFRSVDWIECEPGPEAVEIGTAACPGWARRSVLDKLSLDDLERRDEWIDECKANARLMAAAPDLYAVVAAFVLNRRSIRTEEPFGGALAKLFAMADAALAKAGDGR